MSTESELKPCPFCGSEGKLGEVTEGENFGGQFIECTNPMCGCSTCLMFPSMDSVKEQLAEKWNRRSAELTAALAANAQLSAECQGLRDEMQRRYEIIKTVAVERDEARQQIAAMTAERDVLRGYSEQIKGDLKRADQRYITMTAERNELAADCERLRDVLRKIAKPALGGKIQQQIARAALTHPDPVNPTAQG